MSTSLTEFWTLFQYYYQGLVGRVSYTNTVWTLLSVGCNIRTPCCCRSLSSHLQLGHRVVSFPAQHFAGTWDRVLYIMLAKLWAENETSHWPAQRERYLFTQSTISGIPQYCQRSRHLENRNLLCTVWFGCTCTSCGVLCITDIEI